MRQARKILIRTDTAGSTHDFLDWITAQRMSYSVGFSLPDDFATTLKRIPKRAWTPAIDADGEIRDGAWVAEVSDLLNLDAWPGGMRVIIRAERPHPGAHLRITDADAQPDHRVPHQLRRGQLAHLELRHRRRARTEDPPRETPQSRPGERPSRRRVSASYVSLHAAGRPRITSS